MPKIYTPIFFLVSFLMLFSCRAWAQADTVNAKSQTYLQVYYSLTNTPDSFSGKSNLSVELGKQWNVFSLGVDLGKTTLEAIHGRDTSFYFEARPNLNIFQQGRFTNTLTIGVGYVFLAKSNFLSELTSGIEYSANEHLHLNVNFGQFYYSGRTTASTVTFFGTSVSYFFSAYRRRSSLIKQQ